MWEFLLEWHSLREGVAGAPLERDQPLHLQSLEVAELKVALEARLGFEVPIENLLSGPTPAQLLEALDALANSGTAPAPAPLQQAPAADRGVDPHEPFALTPIQQAYLVGRSGVLELGRYSTHAYYEFDVPDADMPRLEAALRTVIDRHGMLRAIVLPDGRQRVLESVDPYTIAFQDLSALPEDETAARLEAVRSELSHQVLPADRWPLFEIRASRIDERVTRIHLSVDLLILDAQSIMLVLRDWANTYFGVSENGTELVSFRDYLRARSEVERSDAYERAREYWMERLADLPPGPELPLARPPAESDGRFARREVILDQGTSAALNRYARELRVTPSAVLATAFSEVLSVWSARSHFLLNLTVGDRLPLVPDVNAIAGDFTTSIPLEVDLRGAEGFAEKAIRIQRRLAADLDNRLFPGVSVQRELARLGGVSGLVAPVVFTSVAETALNNTEEPLWKVFGEIPYGISQTPQVHLDHQAYQRGGRFELVFDAVEDLFPDGLLDAMLAGYETLLKRVTSGEDDVPAGELLAPGELHDRRRANDTETPIEERLLHAGIERQAAERPDAPAVLCGDRAVTYGELDRRANQIARRLQELGAEPGQLVAVVMEHGWEQVAAVLGILRSGAAYLPVDARLPERRLWGLVEQGGCRIALTQSHVREQVEWRTGVERLVVDDEPAWRDVPAAPVADAARPHDLAYVIFTSGSTGEPKGVMIEHRAAANTIDDCLSRFEITERDRIFGISSLSFDLSVFDVFGALQAGAAVVLPEPSATRAPGRWAELVRQHGVTVWNSVPALLEMLVEYADGRPEVVGSTLRLAMLSGDWIPVDLPDRLRALVPGCRVVGMGGATEASIWSVLHEIESVDPDWKSIPYGRPMANQRLHVLDGNLEPRPVWVPGEICIAGAGLATGYWRDPEKTAERFVDHPVTGERLYRTGDLGRYLPGGEIEFLGREDNQVKVGGHRVELGEIESALCENPAIRSAVVTAPGERRGHRRLVAYYVPGDEPLEACDLRSFVGERLPEYMVPQTFVALPALPLTSNGKVDRRALPAPPQGADACAADPADAAAQALAAPSAEHAEVEQLLTDIWKEVLGVDGVGRGDDFFDLGGDSLQATRVIAKAGAAGWRLDADMFFRLATLAAVAAAATPEELDIGEQAPLVGEVPLTPSQAWFFDHDFSEPDHWNGFWPLLVVEEPLDPDLLRSALHEVIAHHDGLRMRLRRDSKGWHAIVADPKAESAEPFGTIDLSGLDEPELTDELEAVCARNQAELDLAQGPVLRLTYFDLGPGREGRLHLAAHWAVLDYYSSRVVFEDLWLAYRQLAAGESPRLSPKTTSIRDVADRLQELARSDAVRSELPMWLDPRRKAAALPTDHDLGPNDQASTEQVLVMYGAEETEAIVQALPRASGCNVAEAIIAAVARALWRWSGAESTVIELEAYGRWSEVLGIDVSRTVGRLSTFTPLLVEAPGSGDRSAVLASVVDQVRSHPRHGIGQGLLRYMGDPEARRALAEMPAPPINVNYWGQTNEYLSQAVMPFDESPGPLYAASGQRPRLLDVFGLVIGSQLALVWSYSRNLHRQETVAALAEDAASELLWLAGGDPATADLSAEPLEKSVLHR